MLNAFTKFSPVAIAALLGAVAHAAASDTAAQFPELPAAKNYLHVAEIATGDFSKKLKLPTGGKAAALRYIFQRMPVREFETEMLKEAPALKKGHTQISLRSTPSYGQAYEACDWVSQRMALLVVGDALRVYKRKVLRPDELTKS